MKKKTFVTILMAIVAINADAQCRYCNTYEDFLEGRWQQLDTIYCESHSKSRQIWWGGNDYTLTTGDKSTDKILKKDAFVVMQADTLYVNCRNLRYQKTRLGNGYTKAMRIGQRSLLFVNRIIGNNAQSLLIPSGLMFGALGGAITASQQVKQQVCYVISFGADSEGRIAIRLIDDDLMDQMIINRDDLHHEYYAEDNDSKRMLATHVIPILEKAGLFEQAQQKVNEKEN